MNNCKNCIFWKALKEEPEMGICFKANSGNKNPQMEGIKTLPSGIAIRCVDPEDDMPPLKVYFGMDFGCVRFEESV